MSLKLAGGNPANSGVLHRSLRLGLSWLREMCLELAPTPRMANRKRVRVIDHVQKQKLGRELAFGDRQACVQSGGDQICGVLTVPVRSAEGAGNRHVA
jgi:hypothetical protein